MAKRRRLIPTPTETKSASPDAASGGGIHGMAAPSAPPAPSVPGAGVAGPVSAGAPPPVAKVAGDAAGAAALEEMSEFLARARAEGRLLQQVPLRQIDTRWLERDRVLPPDPAADEDMAALMASLRDRGQQVPVDLVRLPGRPNIVYGLVSGLRRVTALRLLALETRDERFAQVMARIVAPEDGPEAYRAMVEENEIRAGLSFYERARIAVKAVEAGAFADRTAALRGLFGNVSRAKRSKIGSFVPLVEVLDGALHFPAALSEKRGLALAKALDADPGLGPRLRAALEAAGRETGTAEAEQAAIDMALRPARPGRTGTAGAGAAGRAEQGRGAGAEVAVARRGGRLVLSGPGVTPELEGELRAWLDARGT